MTSPKHCRACGERKWFRWWPSSPLTYFLCSYGDRNLRENKDDFEPCYSAIQKWCSVGDHALASMDVEFCKNLIERWLEETGGNHGK